MEKKKKKFLWENKNEDERGGKKERRGIQMKGSREREEGEENEEDGQVRIR